jgi:glycogen operon protein
VLAFGYRCFGSPDLYAHKERGPEQSINFVTSHDGFTLNDLVSYNVKHNEVNAQGGRDGSDANLSWNCGLEGPTAALDIERLRCRQIKNFLAITLLSLGVPMLLMGDEVRRTQGGNNNAYCQDNEISWFDWDLDEAQRRLLAFTRRLIALRSQHPVFHRRDFFGGSEDADGSGLPDIRWFRQDGREMSRRDWRTGDRRALGVFLNGEEIPSPSPTGEPVIDDSFIMLVNAGHEPTMFRLLPRRFGNRWRQVISTVEPDAPEGWRAWPARADVAMEARSVLVLRRAW